MHYECRVGNLDAVKLLLNYKDDIIDINAQDFFGDTLLTSVCYGYARKNKLEYLEIMKLIIKHPNFNSLDKHDNWGYNANRLQKNIILNKFLKTYYVTRLFIFYFYNQAYYLY